MVKIQMNFLINSWRKSFKNSRRSFWRKSQWNCYNYFERTIQQRKTENPEICMKEFLEAIVKETLENLLNGFLKELLQVFSVGLLRGIPRRFSNRIIHRISKKNAWKNLCKKSRRNSWKNFKWISCFHEKPVERYPEESVPNFREDLERIGFRFKSWAR